MIATRTIAAATLILILAGCSSSVALERAAIPRPHVEKIPIDVLVRIPENFQNFTHEENVLGRDTWSIDLGSTNASFFQQLFGYMFDSVAVIGPDDDPVGMQFDALIEPSIEGFEFSVPNQSKTEAFAVWVRYRLQVYDSRGTDAGVWTVSAYGKSQKAGLGGSESLRRAAILAMRDAAALILLQFDNATNLSALADGPLAEGAAPVLAGTEPVRGGGIGIFAIGGIDDESQ